jgi:outer membrane immunogenic protein
MKKCVAAIAAAISIAATSSSFAADLAVKAAPPPPLPVWTWTGFYLGVHLGAGWGETEETLTAFSAPIVGIAGVASFPFNQNSRSGFLGGGQVGYNWQTGLLVLGVQGDIAGMDVTGTDPCLVFLSCRDRSNWLASVTGRLGAVVLDRGLVYAKGGAAWLNTTHTVSLPSVLIGAGGGAVALLGANSNADLASHDSTPWGWTLGFGTEWMITRNWSAFFEYDYYRFEKQNVAFGLNPLVLGTPVTVNADIRNTLSIAKVGVNYKFDWGAPLVAKY